MEESDNKNQSDFCRLCASRGQLFSIFELKNGSNFQNLISKHLNFNVIETDIFPTKMCDGCEEKLISFNEYYETCSRVQDWLEKWIMLDGDKMNIEISTNTISEGIMPSGPILPLYIPKDETNNEALDNKSFSEYSHAIPNDIVPTDNKPLSAILEDSQNNDEYTIKFDTDDRSDCSDVPLARVSRHTKKTTKRRKNNCRKLNIDFTCSACKVDCGSWYHLKRHSKLEHNIVSPSVQCLLCNVMICSRTALYIHVAGHENPSVYKCDLCPKITKSSVSLEKHKLRHIPKSDRLFKCDVCPKISKTKDALKTHKQIHIPIEERRRYECDICKMKFTAPRSVLWHKRTVHEKIKSCICDVCGFRCATKPELKQHRTKHTDEKLFVCELCSKRFKTASNLNAHMDTHENSSYQCHICNKVLNSRRTFRKHKLVHDTQRKFTCSYCNVSFKRKPTLQAHMNSHTGAKPIACKWCDERFKYWATLRTHKLRHHADKMFATNDVDHHKLLQ